jgi:hypothetical protein
VNHKKTTLVTYEYVRNMNFDTTEVHLSPSNFDFLIRVQSMFPFFGPNDKIEEYFSVEAFLEDNEWNQNFT